MGAKLRWAILGIGRFSAQRGGVNAISYAHAEALRRNADRFELVAAATRTPRNLADFQREYPCNGYTDLYELLEKEHPDGVAVCTWAPDREAHVLAALRAGVKYVLIEKPLALSPASVATMRAEAEKHGARLFVNFQRRYGKPFELARAACREGRLGRISSIEMYQPCSNLLDFGPHFINMALYFLDDRAPQAVLAATDAPESVSWHGMRVEKRLAATLLFEGGVRVSMLACPENNVELPAIRINGDAGFAELYLAKPEGAGGVYRCLTAQGLEAPTMAENFHHGDEDPYLYFERCYRDLGEAIGNEAPCRVDFAPGELTQRIQFAIYASAQTHGWVAFTGAMPEPSFRFETK